MISIIILAFTSIIINFIFLLIYRLAVKEIGEKDERIKNQRRLIDFYEEHGGNYEP